MAVTHALLSRERQENRENEIPNCQELAKPSKETYAMGTYIFAARCTGTAGIERSQYISVYTYVMCIVGRFSF